MPRFVVHEHHSRHLHWDFRLELQGVLKSWAVPKGPSMNPRDKRLAIQVEDHPLQYASYEGIIPRGHYGAGEVLIWDEGEFEPQKVLADRIEFTLRGRKLKGGFVLARMKGREANQWLLIKRSDQYAQRDFQMRQALSPSVRKRLKEKVPPCEVRE